MAKAQIKISPDHDPQSPREWDNMGTMVCWHRRYNLGDENSEAELKQKIMSVNENIDCSDWLPGQLKEWLDMNKYVCLPLYLYDHGGITISTSPFACRFDSGQVGFIYASVADIMKNWNEDKYTPELKEKALALLNSEVETYDQYLRGDIYGFELQKVRKDGSVKKEIDSCWGFFGDDPNTNGMMEHIPEKYQNAPVVMAH